MSNQIPFTKDELVIAIRNGNDLQDNSVVVTLDGKIQVVALDVAQQNPNQYAVRHETFNAGNDYVGLDASEDETHIDGTFENLVKAWNKHIRTGTTSVYANGFGEW